MERRVFARADRVVVTTPGAAELYAARFPDYPSSQIQLIENGYDEEVFLRASAAQNAADAVRPASGRPITLLHSGIIYPSERDPTQFFRALARLKGRGALSATTLQVVLRATANDALLGRELDALGIRDLVRLEPPVDYLAALREMLAADSLLVLQASNCNAQVPAKIYEYIRAGRPILALTDPAGDTARTLDSAGAGLIARLDSEDDIVDALPRFLAEVQEGTTRRPTAAIVAQYSRTAQAGRLARLLDEVVA
jgi:glycosyltransferase involved in cell wall biosynthesis